MEHYQFDNDDYFDEPPRPANDEAGQEADSKTSAYAEQAIISSLLADSAGFEEIQAILTPSDFITPQYQLIFQAALHLHASQTHIDCITVSEHLNQKGQLEQAGGFPALVELVSEGIFSSESQLSYAKLVKELSLIRCLVATANTIKASATKQNRQEFSDLMAQAQDSLQRLSEQRPASNTMLDMKRLLKQTTARIDYLFQNKGEITGLATGISDLDKKTSGLQGGELIILAARPSMGKTALALNFVQNALFTQDSPVIVFSLEMPATQLMMRLYSSVGSICQGKLRNGQLDESDWPKLELAARRLKDRPLFIDETGNLTCGDVRAKVKQVASTNGAPALVMIDYLQLMRGNNQSSREQQVSEISRTLKAIAKDFNCPVVALSQLNRGVESRNNKRPTNSDLRESGAIEQDADLILFIYRDEYYNPETKDKGMAELIIGKQRNGELGVCLAAYEGRYTRFQNPPVMQGRDVGDGYF